VRNVGVTAEKSRKGAAVLQLRAPEAPPEAARIDADLRSAIRKIRENESFFSMKKRVEPIASAGEFLLAREASDDSVDSPEKPSHVVVLFTQGTGAFRKACNDGDLLDKISHRSRSRVTRPFNWIPPTTWRRAHLRRKELDGLTIIRPRLIDFNFNLVLRDGVNTPRPAQPSPSPLPCAFNRPVFSVISLSHAAADFSPARTRARA
jgi:hypothetical protein